jgi:tetratricopeptide (TPR) repeat protein
VTLVLPQNACRFWLGVLLVTTLSGCASIDVSRTLASLPPDIPAAFELRETPYFPQEQNHCGPAALATLLNHRQVVVSPETLSQTTYLPASKGSLQIELAATARQYGVLVYPIQGDMSHLIEEVAAGNPVLILQNQAFGWFPRWHYAVVVGYDLEQQDLILRSGGEKRWISDFSAFLRTWKRAKNWGIVIMPAGALPATAEVTPYLSAALDLELSNQSDAAHQAYTAAVKAWPNSALAWLTLGNSAYARGEWPLSIDAFRQATRLEPTNSSTWNNLAYALLQGGHTEAALAAVEQAIALSPGDANLQHSKTEIVNRLPASVE